MLNISNHEGQNIEHLLNQSFSTDQSHSQDPWKTILRKKDDV